MAGTKVLLEEDPLSAGSSTFILEPPAQKPLALGSTTWAQTIQAPPGWSLEDRRRGWLGWGPPISAPSVVRGGGPPTHSAPSRLFLSPALLPSSPLGPRALLSAPRSTSEHRVGSSKTRHKHHPIRFQKTDGSLPALPGGRLSPRPHGSASSSSVPPISSRGRRGPEPDTQRRAGIQNWEGPHRSRSLPGEMDWAEALLLPAERRASQMTGGCGLTLRHSCSLLARVPLGIICRRGKAWAGAGSTDPVGPLRVGDPSRSSGLTISSSQRKQERPGRRRPTVAWDQKGTRHLIPAHDQFPSAGFQSRKR